MSPINYTVELSKPHLTEALVSNRPGSLCKRCRLNFDEKLVELTTADDALYLIPFSAVKPNGMGLAPDFTDCYIADYGHTICFGEYEAATEAMQEAARVCRRD